jgi:hypothetical protein
MMINDDDDDVDDDDVDVNERLLLDGMPLSPLSYVHCMPSPAATARGALQIRFLSADAFRLGGVVVEIEDRLQLGVDVDHHGGATWEFLRVGTLWY